MLEVHQSLACTTELKFSRKMKINFVFQVNLLSKYTIVDRQGHKGGDSNSNHWKIYIRGKVLSTVHTTEVRPGAWTWYSIENWRRMGGLNAKCILTSQWSHLLLRKSKVFYWRRVEQVFVLSDLSVWGGKWSIEDILDNLETKTSTS